MLYILYIHLEGISNLSVKTFKSDKVRKTNQFCIRTQSRGQLILPKIQGVECVERPSFQFYKGTFLTIFFI